MSSQIEQSIRKYKSVKSSYDWKIHYINKIRYEKALNLQKQLWKQVKAGDDHHLLFLEHEPVITMGRRTDKSHLLKTPDELEKSGIELFEVNRGGSATYHGPGQLVGYIICKSSRLGGIHELVSRVLKSINGAINDFDVKCKIDEENPGIWTDTETPRKLAAVGMQNKKGITMHGFAVNIDMPLTGFSAIVPCGLTLPVSTLSIEKGESVGVDQFRSVIEPILLNKLDS